MFSCYIRIKTVFKYKICFYLALNLSLNHTLENLRREYITSKFSSKCYKKCLSFLSDANFFFNFLPFFTG